MPGFNPENPKQFERLLKAKKYAYGKLENFRRVRQLIVDATAGHYYDTSSRNPRRVREPVNMLDQYVNVLVRTFVQSRPTVRVTYAANPRQAAVFEGAVNRWIVEDQFVETLRRAVRESLIGYLGIVKTGLQHYGQLEIDDVVHEIGQPYADAVTLDDWVWDMQAERVGQCDFMGHRSMRRLEGLLDNPLYDQDVVQRLAKRGTESWDQGTTDKRYDESLYDRVDIWELYLPQSKMIVWTADSVTDKPLRWEPWIGPEWGPYRFLKMDEVPGKIMPNCRAAMLLDMHDFVNRVYRDIFTKTRQSKDIFGYEGDADDDADRMRRAHHGEFVRVNNAQGVQRIKVPGPNPQEIAVGIHSRQVFDELSGYIRSLGGGGPEADTLGQQRIRQGNSSRLVLDMNAHVLNFTREILRDVAWYVWTDQLKETEVQRQVTEFDSVTDVWPPEIVEGDFVEHEIDIEPDSMTYRTGEQQFQALMEIIQGIVIPGMQLPSERPPVLQLDKLLDKAAKRKGVPDLSEVVSYASDDSFVSQGQPGPQGNGRPQQGPDNRAVPKQSAEDQMFTRMAFATEGGDDGSVGGPA